MEVPGEQEADFTLRFGQLAGPVMAKGAEDTTFYIYNRFTALNEVGGDPASASLPIRDFHQFNEQRARQWPASMTATSTHDTKLSEDVRMRIATISVFAHEWVVAARRWITMNAPFRQTARSRTIPDIRDEYRF